MIKKEKIISSLKSKDGKVIIENFFSLGIVQIANYILPFITIPYVTRIVGVEKFGILMLATTIIMYFRTLIDFGFDYSATKKIAQNRDNIQYVNNTFNATLFAKFYLFIISTIIFIIISFFIDYIKENLFVYWSTFLILPGYLLFPTWFFQGIEKMKFTAMLNFIMRLLFTLLIFIFIKSEKDYIYYPLLMSLGMIITGVISIMIIKYKFKMSIKVPSWQTTIKEYKSSFDVFLNLLFPNFYNGMSSIFLGMFYNNFLVGIFSAGKKIIEIVDMFFALFAKTFFPYLARNIDKHRFYSKYIIILSVFISVILFVCSDFIIFLLYGNKFEEAITILKIMSISPVFLQLMSTYGTNFLILINQEKLLRKITMYSSIIGFFLTLSLTYFLKAKGAAISVVTIWGLRGGLSYYYSLKFKKSSSKLF